MRTTLATVLVFLCCGRAWAAEDTCEITLEGAVTGTASQAGNSGSVLSDYWLSEEELRTATGAMMGVSPGTTDPAKVKKLDEKMKSDPRNTILVVNCATADARISLMASQGSKYKDLPMKAGKYKISGNPGKTKAGEIVSLSSVRGGSWFPDGDGELVLSDWNKKHIAGTFRLPVRDGDQKTVVKGKFDFPCRQSSICEK